MYNYSVYKDTRGYSYVNNLITRSTYYVVDPGLSSSYTFYYSHKTLTAPPNLYAYLTVSTPDSLDGSSTYSVSLYSSPSKGFIQALTVSPTEAKVSKDLVIPRDIYIGTSKEWKVHVDATTKSIVFQKLNPATNEYLTEFEIQHTAVV